MTKTINKSAAARAAKAAGLKTFTATCQIHGDTAHSSSTAKCLACKAAENARSVATPEGRAASNEYCRTRFATNDTRRGQVREHGGARAWRLRTGGNMTGWYALERDALRQRYGAMHTGFEMDHGVPKKAYGLIDGERVQIVAGLHCWANLVETPKDVNREKQTQFAPDTNRLQRPANRGPGGAFDPRPTVHEFELIANAAYEGTPARVSLKALKETLDAQARAYEAHVDAVESDLCVRYTNAIALMPDYARMMVANAAVLSETSGLATLEAA
jgi:hypothetical protein